MAFRCPLYEAAYAGLSGFCRDMPWRFHQWAKGLLGGCGNGAQWASDD